MQYRSQRGVKALWTGTSLAAYCAERHRPRAPAARRAAGVQRLRYM